MMLVAATLMTGTGFNEVVTVKAATNVETGAGFELRENGDIYNMTPESVAYYEAQGYTFDENGNFTYSYNSDGQHITRIDWLDKDGYDKNGYDKNGYDRSGYDSAGYGKDGYNRDGYDENGYDRDGYDKKGYDKNHYNRNGKYDPAYARNPNKEEIEDDVFKIIPSDCSGTKNSYSIYDDTGKNGKKIVDGLKAKIKNHKDNWNFTAKITPIAVKHGYGYYKLTMTYNERYNNYVYTTTIKVFPKVRIEADFWPGEKGQMYVIGTKNAFKNIDGVQFKIVKLNKNKKVMLNKYISSKSILAKKDLKDMGNKQYKKLYAKAQKDLLKEYGFNSKDGTVKFFWVKQINDMGCRGMSRVYIVVNGKRYYS